MLLTTLDNWRTAAASRLPLADPVWAPDEPAAALEAADAAFPAGQVVAADLAPVPADAVDVAALDDAALRYLRRAPDGRHSALLDRPDTAAALDLLPHPEGGWFRETWRTAHRFTPSGYPGERASATGIHFLLPPGEESMWHVVRSDELWLWHHGGPLTLLLGGTGDRPGPPTPFTLGPDLAAGHAFQALVPAGHWQAARPATAQEVLVSCIVSPGFDFADFRA